MKTRDVTVEELQAAMQADPKPFVKARSCSLCSTPLGYVFASAGRELLGYNSNCSCVNYYVPFHPTTWSEIAGFINMQANEAVKVEIAARFGVVLGEHRAGQHEGV